MARPSRPSATRPTTCSAWSAAAADVEGVRERRKARGFNRFRVRLLASASPAGDFEWQTRRMWPWGGSPTSPRFDLLNLDWFKAVDGSIARMEAMGLGIELIREGWGFEFPFNHRAWFTPEGEQLWMRWLIARYDAYNCVHFRTSLNEYEDYPNGDWNWTVASDRWLMRVGRWIKDTAPDGHLVACHDGPRSHIRRAAWRGVTQAMGIINGQENSWGPWMLLREDLPGTADIVVIREFPTDAVPFHDLRPAPDLVGGSFAPGHRSLALRSIGGDVAVVYNPADGAADIAFAASDAQGFAPRTAAWPPAAAEGHPLDTVLVLRR